MTVRDLPDNTKETIIKFTGGFIGLEEMVVRLGSIVPFDLRGNVILWDDFESELTEWTLTAVGSNSSAARSSGQKWSGDWALKLVCDNEVGALSSAERIFPANEATRLALFGRLGFTEDVKDISLSGGYRVGGTVYFFELRYSPADQTLKYLDQDANYQTLASFKLGGGELTWWPMLLVVDFTTGYYIKAIFGGYEYDLSAYIMQATDATGESPTGALSVLSNSVGGIGGTLYVEDIIILKNVP